MTYLAKPVPGQAEALPSFLREELHAIEKGIQDAKDFLELRALPASPKRLRPGMLVYADGVNFDPGSGEGLYRRDAANANWIFLG